MDGKHAGKAVGASSAGCTLRILYLARFAPRQLPAATLLPSEQPWPLAPLAVWPLVKVVK